MDFLVTIKVATLQQLVGDCFTEGAQECTCSQIEFALLDWILDIQTTQVNAN